LVKAVSADRMATFAAIADKLRRLKERVLWCVPHYYRVAPYRVFVEVPSLSEADLLLDWVKQHRMKASKSTIMVAPGYSYGLSFRHKEDMVQFTLFWRGATRGKVERFK